MRLPPIDADIRLARTLPGRAYRDPELFEVARERVFARAWHLVLDDDRLGEAGSCVPVDLLPGVLDEPLLLTRDAAGTAHAFSNVCTHRGAILCEKARVFGGTPPPASPAERGVYSSVAPATPAGLRCRYHGRRFGLDGRFLSMPEFEGAVGFPTRDDDLRHVPLARLGRLLFVSLEPAVPFEELISGVLSRIGFLPLGEAVFSAERSRDYEVKASWALYCDNFLEGFHIPFVHPALNQVLDYGDYRTELLPHGSLQIGVARKGDTVLEPPEGHPDHGLAVGGYYFWLFPGTMLNVYPWGLSVNVIQPLAVDRSRVSYLTYVWDESLLDQGAGSGLHTVEMEDEAVVESVQKGVRSRLYDRGRYSPARETGVHHFHRMLVNALERP
jgi:choline monooxygenase